VQFDWLAKTLTTQSYSFSACSRQKNEQNLAVELPFGKYLSDLLFQPKSSHTLKAKKNCLLNFFRIS
jgi:hypothetical protein